MKSILRTSLKNLQSLAGLFRPDAAAISFLSYLVGVLLVDQRLEASDFRMASLITFISTNFIYSYNCLTDRHEDAVGHPDRPLPSGRLTPFAAGLYSAALLVAALIYPFFCSDSQISRLLMLLLPVLGILYSADPFRLRRFPLPSILIICTGLVIPLTLGLLQGASFQQIRPITIGVFLFCLATVPLKSMEEVEEARQTGRSNIYFQTGRKLFGFSAFTLVLSATWALLMVKGPMKSYLELISGLSLIILIYSSRKAEAKGLYRSIIRLVILTGLALFLLSL